MRAARALAIGAMSGLAALGATIVWVNGSTWSRTYDDLADMPAREIVLVPGIGARPGRIPLALRERLESALAVYRANKAQAILVSGIGGEPGHDEVVTMVRWLTDRGVDPARILSDPAGYRTLDTMRRASQILGVSRAIIVTQRLYIPRALFLARAAGIDAVGFAAPSTIPMAAYRIRTEALKSGLAVADTYVLGTNPRHLDTHGAQLSQAPARENAASTASSSANQPPAAFNFLTSAISAGTAASQVATSP